MCRSQLLSQRVSLELETKCKLARSYCGADIVNVLFVWARVGVGREGHVLMMSLCMQMCLWEEFGISHFLLCIEIFRIGSYSLRERFYQMINFFLFAMLLTDCRDAIKFLKIIILGFYVLNIVNYWMHQLNLSLVFKILIKSEGGWFGNKTLDERGHVMLECIMANAGATRYS